VRNPELSQASARLPRRLLLGVVAAVCFGAGHGCSRIPGLREATVASYQPGNVHRADPSLPVELKRVAMLPVTTLTDEASMEFGRDALGPLLANELARARAFELVVVTPEQLRGLTGRNTWTGEERLPLNFFETLKDRLGVDGVLFARLTQYRPYEPLSIGWRVKLIEAEEPRVLWAVDEVFDARVPGVAAAARRYARAHPGAAGDVDGVLSSARQFGLYTASALVSTLPPLGRPAQADKPRASSEHAP